MENTEIDETNLVQIDEPEKKQGKKRRKLRKPKRLKYFNIEQVNEVYVKSQPNFIFTSNQNTSISVIKSDQKNSDILSNMNTDTSHREISIQNILNKPQQKSTSELIESPISLVERRKLKVSSIISTNSLSKFSSNPSLDYLQSPLSTEPVPLKNRSRFTQKSEISLPKILNSNSTFNNLPSQLIEQQSISSINSINQITDTLTFTATPNPNSSIFQQNIKQSKSQSCVNSPSTVRQQSQQFKRLKNISSSSAQLCKGFLPQLNDNLTLTNKQKVIKSSKSQFNILKDQKSIFTINQAISPRLQSENNLRTEKSLDQYHKDNSINSNNLYNNNVSKKYNKYASFIDLPQQKDMRQEILKLLTVKNTPKINIPNLKKKDEVKLRAPPPPEKPKIDYHMIQVRKQIKQKFKRAKLRLRILLGFFNKLRKAISNRREYFLKELQTGVLTKEAINDIMLISMRVSKNSLLMLFQEHSTFDYYNYVKDRKNFILRRQRLRQFAFNITSDYIESSNEIIDHNSAFIKFISLHTRNYSHFANQFWPSFILERLEFTNYGQIKNLTQKQKEMISIYLYFVYGICNRLVRPWATLKIEENYVKEKNAQLVMSLIFYMMIDYIRDNNPIQQNNYLTIPEQYQPKVRLVPLNTYNDILQKDYLFQIGGQRDSVYEFHVNKPDINKIQQELEQQKILNENIMIGLHPRNHIEDLVSRDEQIRKSIHTCFQKGAALLLSKVYSFNLTLNEKLFQYID